MIVTLPYDPTWKALDWAKENCPSYTTNQARAGDFDKVAEWDTRNIEYVFSDEADAIMFMLKWA